MQASRGSHERRAAFKKWETGGLKVNLPAPDLYDPHTGPEGQGTTLILPDMLTFITEQIGKLPIAEPCEEELVVVLLGPYTDYTRRR